MRNSAHAFHDPLMGLRSFFSDSEALAELGATLKSIVQRDTAAPIRVWVPDCSTGEEAYTIAVLVAEQLAAHASPRRVLIVATDGNEHALNIAKKGAYPSSIARDVTPERLQRFFTRTDEGYTIGRWLRQTVSFSVQDPIVDAAVSQFDLVSCRNALTSREPDERNRLVARLRLALAPGGCLFGGPKHGTNGNQIGGPARTHVEELRSTNEKLTALIGRLQEKVREQRAANDELANLLSSTNIATVFLDRELRIKRTTPAAAQLFGLAPSDVGRPIRTVASTLSGVEPSRAARAVLDGGPPIEQEVASQDGRHYIFRALPYCADDGTLQGAVLTLVDVSVLKKTEQELREAREQAATELRRMALLHDATSRGDASAGLPEALQEVLRAAVEITGAEMGYIRRREDDMLVVAAHTGFAGDIPDPVARLDTTGNVSRSVRLHEQRVVVEDLEAYPIVDASPSLQALLKAGVRAMQSTPLFDRSGACLGTLVTHYRAPHRFGEAELRWLDLLARPAEEIIRRRQAEAEMTTTTGVLERRIADSTKWLALMHTVTRAINDVSSWHEGLRLALRQICETERWQVGYVYVPEAGDPDMMVPIIGFLGDERLRPFHLVAAGCRFRRGQLLPGRAYAEGRQEWVNGRERLLAQLTARRAMAEQVGLEAAVVLPIRSRHEVIGVLELFSIEPHEPDALLANLMNDLGAQMGKVLERQRSTAEMADLVWREQQSLLHTLHDSLGQTLTGLGMLASGLRRRVTPAGVESVLQIRQLAQQAIEQVRQLSRGMYPVEVDAHGLVPALYELAGTTETFHRIPVTVQCAHSAPIDDSRVATQIYRIAQEAVTNAVKHATPGTIRIELRAEPGSVHLHIRDDGTGIGPQASSGDGLGLRIMMYRATSIGATLSIEPASPRGTLVACRLPLSPEAFVAPRAAPPTSS